MHAGFLKFDIRNGQENYSAKTEGETNHMVKPSLGYEYL